MWVVRRPAQKNAQFANCKILAVITVSPATICATLVLLRRSRADLLDAPRLDVDEDNADRLRLLGSARGYRRNIMLFQTFPDDVVWRRCRLELAEIGKLLYANVTTLVEVSGPSRAVSDGAQRLTNSAHRLSPEAQQFVDGVHEVVRRVNAADQFEDLILVQDSVSRSVVLLEGHTRATAYTIAGRPTAVNALVGSSCRMYAWRFF